MAEFYIELYLILLIASKKHIFVCNKKAFFSLLTIVLVRQLDLQTCDVGNEKLMTG